MATQTFYQRGDKKMVSGFDTPAIINEFELERNRLDSAFQAVSDVIENISELDWQESVKAVQNAPGTLTLRYIVGLVPSGAWVGHANQLAVGNGTSWTFVTPTLGTVTFNEATGKFLVWGGAAWGDWNASVDHAALLNLTTGDPHTQYTLRTELARGRYTWCVDGNRTDTYVEDGSVIRPYKTIQGAVDAIAALAEAAYHTVEIAGGIYAENVVLEDAGLQYIKLQGNGYVSINPAGGNSLQSTALNSNLKALLVSDIGFAKPVVIVGQAGTASFNDVIWERPKFTGTATLSVSCVNNFSMVDPYSEQPITYNNVGWSYVESGQLQGAFGITMDSTQPLPSSGAAGTLLANGVFQSGAVSYTIGGAATYTVAIQGCRWGTSGAVAVPAGVSILVYNSWMRGTVTNAGTITLRNGNVEGYVAGGGTLVFTANTGTQVDFVPVTSVPAWITPPTSLSNAVDRIAATFGPGTL